MKQPKLRLAVSSFLDPPLKWITLGLGLYLHMWNVFVRLGLGGNIFYGSPNLCIL